MRDRSALLGSLTVVLAAAGFGMLGVLARTAYSLGLEPVALVAWRAAFATLVVVAFAAWRIRQGRAFIAPWRIPVRARAAFTIVCISGLVLNLAMFYAFDLTTVAIVLLGFYTYPAFVAVIEMARGHEPVDAIRVGALGLSLTGMVLVVAGSLTASEGIRIAPLGIVLALVAALSQTVFMTVSRAGYSQLPTEQAAAWILATTMIACAIFATVGGGVGPLTLPLAEPSVLALLAFTGIFAAGIPTVLFLTGIRTIGGTRTGILMLFEPVVGVALAALVLDETLRPIQAIGGVAILAAALLLQRAPTGTRAAGPNAAALPGTIER
jgi:drug/metabolite transporter (DMT)-like permease